MKITLEVLKEKGWKGTQRNLNTLEYHFKETKKQEWDLLELIMYWHDVDNMNIHWLWEYVDNKEYFEKVVDYHTKNKLHLNYVIIYCREFLTNNLECFEKIIDSHIQNNFDLHYALDVYSEIFANNLVLLNKVIDYHITMKWDLDNFVGSKKWEYVKILKNSPSFFEKVINYYIEANIDLDQVAISQRLIFQNCIELVKKVFNHYIVNNLDPYYVWQHCGEFIKNTEIYKVVSAAIDKWRKEWESADEELEMEITLSNSYLK